MFDKFSDGAIKVIAQAQEEANLLFHNHIGSEHILIGVLKQNSNIAATMLKEAGVSLEKVSIEGSAF